MEKIRVNASVSGTIGECPLQKNQAVEKDQILCIIVDENGTQHEVKSEIDATVLEIRNHPNNKVITGYVSMYISLLNLSLFANCAQKSFICAWSAV